MHITTIAAKKNNVTPTGVNILPSPPFSHRCGRAANFFIYFGNYPSADILAQVLYFVYNIHKKFQKKILKRCEKNHSAFFKP